MEKVEENELKLYRRQKYTQAFFFSTSFMKVCKQTATVNISIAIT